MIGSIKDALDEDGREDVIWDRVDGSDKTPVLFDKTVKFSSLLQEPIRGFFEHFGGRLLFGDERFYPIDFVWSRGNA
jgi:hypothetical protein